MSSAYDPSQSRIGLESLKPCGNSLMGDAKGDSPYGETPVWTRAVSEITGGHGRLPGPCLHALAGRVAKRVCGRDYRCEACELDQLVERSHLQSPRKSGSAVEIEGYRYSEQCLYHPGHTWAYAEYGGNVRIGLDDFASSIIGYAESVHMPAPGTRITPGMPLFALRRDRHWVRVLSPLQGVIVGVNSGVIQHPELIRADPFGEGWLVLAKPDRDSSYCEMLSYGEAAREWLAQESGFLRMLLCSGLGGRQKGDYVSHDPSMPISDWAWKTLVETFLHTRVLLQPS